MQYKLVAIDMDDTLLNANLEIHPANREAIAQAVAKGVKVVIASGRMYRSLLPYHRELGLDTPIIAYQGAWVKDPVRNELWYEQPVPLTDALEVVAEAYRWPVDINLYLDDRLYVDRDTPAVRDYAAMSRVDFYPVGNLLDFLKAPPAKILFIGGEEVLLPMQDRLKQLFPHLFITRSKAHYLEVMHPRANKKEALAFLVERFCLTPEEVIAIGDSYNDICMLQFAGVGAAVAGAREEVKAVADFVAAPGDDGVAQVIRKYILEG